MRVVEIFNSIDGEGVRAGLPTTFIRLFGCNLFCSYCDSTYAWKENNTITPSYTEMSVLEIVQKVKSYGCHNITVTGGEPLIHKDIENLLNALLAEDFWVNVETNGTTEPPIQTDDQALFYTMDYKTNASGMSDKMNETAISMLTRHDVLKFVVGSEKDLDQALKVVNKLNPKAQIFVSPVFGKIEGKDIVEYLKRHQLWNWRVQIQLHKILWDPHKKGV